MVHYLRYVVDEVSGDGGGQVPVQLCQHQHLTLLQHETFTSEVNVCDFFSLIYTPHLPYVYKGKNVL